MGEHTLPPQPVDHARYRFLGSVLIEARAALRTNTHAGRSTVCILAHGLSIDTIQSAGDHGRVNKKTEEVKLKKSSLA